MVDRRDPFNTGMRLRDMMDRLLEDAFVAPRGIGEWMSGDGGMPLDVYEEDDNLVVEARLPGMKPEDIDVRMEHGVLTISGETKAEQERKERNYLIREQRSGSVSRSVRLPDTVDPEACEANYDNGVLRLTFREREEIKPRRIPIGTGGQKDTSGGEGQKQG